MLNRMKETTIETTLRLAAVGFAAGLMVGSANGGEGKSEAAAVPGGVPLIVVDEAADDWIVDRFAGNSTAGYAFSQGPAHEAGGIGRPAVAVAPDGNIYLATGAMSWVKDIIVRVSPDGTLRLLAGGGSSLADGPAANARIAVDWRGGGLAWSQKDKSLYFVHATVPAVRRLYRKDDQWSVENVAGNPEKAGADDGPAKMALFGEPRSLVVTSAGTIYVLDGSTLLRKIEDGVVSTLAKFSGGREIVDGPLDNATFAITNMSGQIAPGENDDVLYVADHWHFAARRIDLKTMTVSTVTVSENRDNPKGGKFGRPAHADGPAMTHATYNSGLAYVCYDPVHKALWVGGPDEHRMRWVHDGWVKTVTGHEPGSWSSDGMATPSGKPKFTWGNVAAVDRQGRAYITTPAGGVWRAYNRKEVNP
jgi:sugar lactone lactonase YvrE